MQLVAEALARERLRRHFTSMPRPRHFRVPWIVLGLSLVGTLVAVITTLWLLYSESNQQFAAQVKAASVRLETRMEAFVTLLEAGEGLLTAGEQPDRNTFESIATQLLRQAYPGAQAIAYAVRVTPERVEALEASARESGFDDFHVWPRTTREEHHVALFVEPLSARNLPTLGFDLSSEPTRRAAMEQARDSGAPAMTGKLKLVQKVDTLHRTGVLLFVPVYVGGVTPATVEERREKLQGFIYSAFRAQELFRSVFGSYFDLQSDPRIAVAIYDGAPEEQNLLFDERNDTPSMPTHGFSATSEVRIGGRTWTLVAYSLEPPYPVGFRGVLPLLVLLGGMFISLLLSALAFSEARARVFAERQQSAAEGLTRAGLVLASRLEAMPLLQRLVEEGARLTCAETGGYFGRRSAASPTPGDVELLAVAPTEAREALTPERLAPLIERILHGEVVEHHDLLQDCKLDVPWLSCLGAPVKLGEGEVLGALLFVHSEPFRFRHEDVHLIEGLAAQASVALDNARLYREAQEEVRAREEFLSMASHELKSPLQGLSVRLQLLESQAREGAAPERLLATIEGGRGALQRLSRMITELLDVARLSGGRLSIERTEIDFGEVVRDVAERLEPQPAAPLLRLEMEEGVRGLWDHLRLEQVVTNLVDNALKYGAGNSVDIRLRADGAWAVLEVEDHGIGVDPERLARVFAPFERAVSDRHYAGLGLGLYIARQIVELHGGTIDVESRPGATRFTVRLPRAPEPESEPPAPLS